MADLMSWKDRTLVSEGMACLLEKANFVLKASKKTKVDMECKDIRQLI